MRRLPSRLVAVVGAIVAAVLLLTIWQVGKSDGTDARAASMASVRRDVAHVLEGMTPSDVFESLGRAPSISVGGYFEASRQHREATGDLAEQGILGFQAISLERNLRRPSEVTKLTFWVAESAADAETFVSDEMGGRATGPTEADDICWVPPQYAGATDLRACLASVDKVVVMSIATADPLSILEQGIRSLGALRLN